MKPGSPRCQCLGFSWGKMDRGPYWALGSFRPMLDPVQLGLPLGRAKNIAGGQSSSCDLLKAGCVNFPCLIIVYQLFFGDQSVLRSKIIVSSYHFQLFLKSIIILAIILHLQFQRTSVINELLILSLEDWCPQSNLLYGLG